MAGTCFSLYLIPICLETSHHITNDKSLRVPQCPMINPYVFHSVYVNKQTPLTQYMIIICVNKYHNPL